MIIKCNDNNVEYKCSLCGHQHIKYNDGTFNGEPFKDFYRKIKIPEKTMEQTNEGLVSSSIIKEYDGYVCPKCNKVQMNVLELYE